MAHEFSGIYPMLYSFYNANGSLDVGALAEQVALCHRNQVDGIAVLGVASEVFRLDLAERRAFVEATTRANDGALAYAVTVAESSRRGQVEFARFAKDQGADWIILQLPNVKGVTEEALVSFMRSVADDVDMPVAIQNNPFNMDVSVSNSALLKLFHECDNVTIFKAESPAVSVEKLAHTPGLTVFGGRNGIEIITSLLGGCAGNIPAPEASAYLAEIYRLLNVDNEANLDAAEAIYQRILPLLVFVGQTLQTQVLYGRQCVADQLSVGVANARSPGLSVSEFGLATMRRLWANASDT